LTHHFIPIIYGGLLFLKALQLFLAKTLELSLAFRFGDARFFGFLLKSLLLDSFESESLIFEFLCNKRN
jgi:hypothetical protein